MKQLKQFIAEKLHVSNYKEYNYQPKTIEELREIISKKIDDQSLNKKNEEILDLNDIDTSKINSFNYLFKNLNPIKIDISKWDISNVESMKSMFDGCKYLSETGDLGNWDISNVKNMTFMFCDCINLKNIGDLSSWNVNGIKMSSMFQDCKRLKNIGDISDWKPLEANWAIFQLCPIKIQPKNRV